MRLTWFVNRATPHRSPALDYLHEHGVDVLAVYREGGDGGRGWGQHEHAHPSVSLGEQGGRLRRLIKLFATLSAHHTDVVVIMGYSSVEHVACWILARMKKWSIVTRSDSNILDEAQKSPVKRFLKRVFVRALIPRTCTVLTIGSMNAEYWRQLGYTRQIMIPYRSAPFQEELHSPVNSRDESVDVRSEARLLFVGRLSNEKGVVELLAAYKILKTLRPETRLSLTLIGRGPLDRHVSTAASEDPSIRHLGALRRNDVGLQMLQASLVVLPSKREPWNLVVNEAVSLGVPVACSAVTGAGYDLPVTTNRLPTSPLEMAQELGRILSLGWIARPRPPMDETGPLLMAALKEVSRET